MNLDPCPVSPVHVISRPGIENGSVALFSFLVILNIGRLMKRDVTGMFA